MSQMTNLGTIPQWSVGDRLAKALDHAHVSVQEMADELGVSRNTVSNYTAGRSNIGRAALTVWALRTGVDRTWLETGEVGSTPPPTGPRTDARPLSGVEADDAIAKLTKAKRSRTPLRPIRGDDSEKYRIAASTEVGGSTQQYLRAA